MGLFIGRVPPVEQLLDEPLILRLLGILATDVICVTAGQAGRLLHPAPVPAGHHDALHSRIRRIIDALQVGGYLGAATVERIPSFFPDLRRPVFHLDKLFMGDDLTKVDWQLPTPVPSQPPVFRRDGEPFYHPTGHTSAWLPRAPDLAPYAEFAKTRVPPLAEHQRRKFYYATGEALELIGDRRPELFNRWRAESQHRWEWPAQQLIEAHQLVESRADVTEQEIAATKLTAVFNLTELFTSGWFDARIQAAKWRYGTYGRFRASDRDGTIWVKGEKGIALFFLRPLAPDEIGELVMHWWAKSRQTRTCLWL